MDGTASTDPTPPGCVPGGTAAPAVPPPGASPNSPPLDTPPPGRRRVTAGFVMLGAVQAVLVLAITVITVSLPAVQRDFSTDTGGLVLAGSAYGLSFGGLLLLGGRLTDLAGRLRVLRWGVALFGVASAVAGLAPGLGVFVAARFAQGCGAALAAPAAVALVRTLFPGPEQRARAMAWWGGLASVGATAGMVLSGLVTTWASWRWGMLIPVLVAIAAVPLAPRLFPPDGPVTRARLDIPGAALAAAGLSALGYGLARAVDQAWPTPAVWAPVASGAVLLAAFAVVEARAAAPLLALSLLTPRRVVALAAITVTSAGMASALFILSLYFQRIGGMSPARTSASILPFAVALLAVGTAAGHLTGRFGTRAVTIGGLAIAATGSLTLAGLSARSPYAVAVPAGLALLGAGVALTFAGATVAAFDGATDRQSGPVGGMANTAMELGPSLGPAVLMTLAAGHTTALAATGSAPAAATTGGYAFAFALAGGAFAATALLPALAPRSTRP